MCWVERVCCVVVRGCVVFERVCVLTNLKRQASEGLRGGVYRVCCGERVCCVVVRGCVVLCLRGCVC